MTLKKNNKYSYIKGKQITDVDTGTRFMTSLLSDYRVSQQFLQRQRIKSI